MAGEFVVKDVTVAPHTAGDRIRLTFLSERDEITEIALRASHIGQFAELVIEQIGLDQLPNIDPRSLGAREVYRCQSFSVKPSPNGPVLQFGLTFSDGAQSVLPFSFSDEEAVELIEMLKRAIDQGG